MVAQDIVAILPELILIVASLVSLLIGVYNEKRSLSVIQLITSASLIIALICIVQGPPVDVKAFNDLLLINNYTQFCKSIILATVLIIITMTGRQLKRDQLNRFEYLILIVLSTVGMMFMISANDLTVLFMGLELQSLCLYILMAFKRKDTLAAEGAVKYLVLGTLATIFILYGSSLIYGLTSSTNFDVIAVALKTNLPNMTVTNVGIVMISAGLAFKISLAPFHMWTPDVYQGGPTPVIAFLSSAPKLAAIAILIRLVLITFESAATFTEPLLLTLALLSIAIGTLAALFQKNIKRLIAYSTISHMGYAVLGLCGHQIISVKSVLIYMCIYLITTISLFACLMCLRRNDKVVENIAELSGLSSSQPLIAGILTVILFSLAGIPPLIGFFAKYSIFTTLIYLKYYSVTFISLLLSVIGAAYYLRIVKVMYFGTFDEHTDPFKFDSNVPLETRLVAVSGLIMIIGYIIEPNWLNDTTLQVAISLLSW